MRTKTRTKGVYRNHVKGCSGRGRCDCGYIVLYEIDGRQKSGGTFRTLEKAENRKIELRQQRRSGTYVAPSKLTLHEYMAQWKEKEHRELGIRPQTRDEYHGHLRYAEKFFGPRLKLVEIRRRQVGEFAAWLMRQPGRRAETLSDKSIRNVLNALRQVFNAALDDELIPSHPMDGFKLKRQERILEDDEIGNGQVKVFPGENGDVMELVVSLVGPKYRLIFEVLAQTGMRPEEVFGLLVKDLRLNVEGPSYIAIRRSVTRVTGQGLVYQPIKTENGRRDLPIPLALAHKLEAHVSGRAADEPVFATANGTPYDQDTIRTRVFNPAAARAGVGWAYPYMFRHTVASRQLREGRNIVQVSRWLGHANPTITLNTYAHLLDQDIGAPMEPMRAPESRSKSRSGQNRSERKEGVGAPDLAL